MGRPKLKPGEASFELYEEEIINLISLGYTHKDMKKELHKLELHSIETYIRKIKENWGARNSANLVYLWHLKQKSNG